MTECRTACVRAAARATLMAAIGSLAATASAQTIDQFSIPLSEPGAPARLVVELVQGSVSVRAHDGDDVIVMTEMLEGKSTPAVREDGLRSLPNTSYGLVAEERRNVVLIEKQAGGRSVALTILVPRNTSVQASTVTDGDLTIEGVEGEHELSNVNGGITASMIAGSLVANTTNGDVHVSFTGLTPDKAMSFTSFNGDVDVSFPPDLHAELRISAGRGEILTAFDVAMQQQQPAVIDEGDTAGRYRVQLNREIRATVGGGGPEMYFKTFNGDIVIRDNRADQ